MLRELQNIVSTPANGMFKASEAMVTGMGVVKTNATKTVALPDAETANVVVLVKKDERCANGVYASLNGELPDYDENLTNVKANEFVKFKTYHAGEIIATDQYIATGLTDGVRVTVNTEGKWVKGATTVASNFVYTGTISDCGHTLARIEVVADFAKNA